MPIIHKYGGLKKMKNIILSACGLYYSKMNTLEVIMYGMLCGFIGYSIYNINQPLYAAFVVSLLACLVMFIQTILIFCHINHVVSFFGIYLTKTARQYKITRNISRVMIIVYFISLYIYAYNIIHIKRDLDNYFQ